LKTQVNNPEIESLLSGLLDQTQRLSAIAEKLLLLSRADAGALILNKGDVESGAISVSLKKSGSLALFRIANTGPEIPKDRGARIFERFYRADPSRTSDVLEHRRNTPVEDHSHTVRSLRIKYN
jgi:signal transduction histidine kinase